MQLFSKIKDSYFENERQIQYDLTYRKNLMNTTNKQAKQNQRHGNKEQTDSDQSWGGGGQWGKEGERSSQGTGIKDPWTWATE